MSFRMEGDPPWVYRIKLGDQETMVVATSATEAVELWIRYMDANDRDPMSGHGDWRSSEAADEPDSVSKLKGWAITKDHVEDMEKRFPPEPEPEPAP